MDIEKLIDKFNKTLQYVYIKYIPSDDYYLIYEKDETCSAITDEDTFELAKKKAKHEDEFFKLLEKEDLLIKSLPIQIDLTKSLEDLIFDVTEKNYKDFSFSLNEVIKFHKKNWIKHRLKDE
jgi:hypothetical protein